MSLETALGFASNAAAMRHESETPMRGHTATCCREAELAGLAAAVLDWLRTELAAEGMREAVAEAIGDTVCHCDHRSNDALGFLCTRCDATAALEAVAERLAEGER